MKQYKMKRSVFSIFTNLQLFKFWVLFWAFLTHIKVHGVVRLSWERLSLHHTGQTWDNLERKILLLVIWLFTSAFTKHPRKKQQTQTQTNKNKKTHNTKQPQHQKWVNCLIFRIFVSQQKVYCHSQNHWPDWKLPLLAHPQPHKEHESTDTSPWWKPLTNETGVSWEEELEHELAQTINYGCPKASDRYILPISVLQLMVHMPVQPDLIQWLGYWRVLKLPSN